jgi:hypothetical protein
MPPDGNVPAQGARLASLVSARSGGAKFSLAEVSLHNTPADCWLIVRGKVYDVTQWCARGRPRASSEQKRARGGHVRPGVCRPWT